MIKIKKIWNFNIHYRPNSSDEDVLEHSFENDIFYNGIPEYSQKKKAVIIDVGAHIGTFSILSSMISPKGKIFAIEPCKETFEILQMNKIENKIENLFISNIALSDFKGETKLFYDNEYGNWGHSISKEISNDGEIVNTNTLQNYFFENEITYCDLIKFNCEGSEFDILLNTPIDILLKIRFALVLFHEDLTKDNLKYSLLVEKLEKANFTVKVRNLTSNPTRGWIIAYRGNVFKKYFMQTNFFFKIKIKSKINENKTKIKSALKSVFLNLKKNKNEKFWDSYQNSLFINYDSLTHEYEIVNKIIDKYLIQTICDYGCGPGRMIPLWCSNSNLNKIIMFDISSKAIQFCQQKIKGIQINKFTFFSSKLENQFVDLIFINRVMQHIHPNKIEYYFDILKYAKYIYLNENLDDVPEKDKDFIFKHEYFNILGKINFVLVEKFQVSSQTILLFKNSNIS